MACNAAPAANRVWRPQNCQSFASSPSSLMSQLRTSAEILVGNREASKTVVMPTPDAPAIRFFQSSSTRTPSGVTSPIPVMTTLRLPATIVTVPDLPVGPRQRLPRLVAADIVDVHLVEPLEQLLRLEQFRHALARLEVGEK